MVSLLFVVEVEVDDSFVVDVNVVDVFEVVKTLVVFELEVLPAASGRHWPRNHG